jgi:hypothetical protein
MDAAGDAGTGAWTGPEVEAAAPGRLLPLERQLELVDRVRRLEAELEQLSSTRHLTPSETLSAERQLVELRNSLPWRVGRIITIPVRVAQRAARRLRAR